jgi:thioredoxin reductase/NAD-dependent dihydropyrimidine dehydrogenase PreA subunit
MDLLDMEVLIEKIVIYGGALLLCGGILYIYLRKMRRESDSVKKKIELAKESGLFEPISLHPHIDLNTCIKSGACITACPEKDILGIQDGKATLINASRCIGHGACFHACPVEAISLIIGTEKRGVELPHVSPSFETNVPGVYIAGELGGMGLIKNSVEQGKQAVDNIMEKFEPNHNAEYDLVIVGAGPAGISASCNAKQHGLKSITLEQDTLGGTVFSFPRAKIVMTAPMDLPLHGKVKLYETSKGELLDLWNDVLSANEINIRENSKVDAIIPVEDHFKINLKDGASFTTHNVLLAIGRRGSPRKLNVPGEELEKVAYRLLEPEHIEEKNIVVVGGGDSAIESAMLLADKNNVILSYRGPSFKRIKPKNHERVEKAIVDGRIEVQYSSNLISIHEKEVVLKIESGEEKSIPNDLVYIFAGGELPTQFLQKVGIDIKKRFGHVLKSHKH